MWNGQHVSVVLMTSPRSRKRPPAFVSERTPDAEAGL
jgi:hypothetical protein